MQPRGRPSCPMSRVLLSSLHVEHWQVKYHRRVRTVSQIRVEAREDGSNLKITSTNTHINYLQDFALLYSKRHSQWHLAFSRSTPGNNHTLFTQNSRQTLLLSTNSSFIHSSKRQRVTLIVHLFFMVLFGHRLVHVHQALHSGLKRRLERFIVGKVLHKCHDARGCAKFVLLAIRRYAPQFVHNVEVMRNALRCRERIRKEIIDLVESCPYYGRDTHAARFMSAQKDTLLGCCSSLVGWRLLGPLINGMHFTVKERRCQFTVGLNRDWLEFVVKNGSTKDFIAIGDALGRQWNNVVFNHFQHALKILWRCL